MILNGNCIDLMREMDANSVDAVVTDPPYGLSKEPDALDVLRHWLAGDDYQHSGGGFMGKAWDSFVPGPSVWREVLRVLKPGGHVLSCGGTRTYDLSVLAMRIAGFEIRDQLAWMYGTGFPKSLDVSKAIDSTLLTGGSSPKNQADARDALGRGDASDDERHGFTLDNGTRTGVYRNKPGSGAEWEPATPEAQRWAGWGTALKPAQEPIVLARKPLVGTVAANVLAHGTGGINVDGCRVGRVDGDVSGWSQTGSKASENVAMAGANYAREPKPDADGRWPANVILDEIAGAMLDEQSGVTTSSPAVRRNSGTDSVARGKHVAHEGHGFSDTGGASRFFYCAKASRSEREAGLDHLPIRSGGELTDREDGSDGLKSPRAGAGRGGGRRNHHPTVKPVELMRYLIRLITPPGGIVLDPFTGSGTTGVAAALEGFRFVGCELSPEYCEIARARIEHVEKKCG